VPQRSEKKQEINCVVDQEYTFLKKYIKSNHSLPGLKEQDVN